MAGSGADTARGARKPRRDVALLTGLRDGPAAVAPPRAWLAQLVTRSYRCAVCLLVLSLAVSASRADPGSKLLATAGGQQLEGQAGGGIVPWALLAGYGDVGEWGASIAATQVRVDDFQLDVAGAAVSIGNRVELSLAQQRLRVEPLDLSLKQDIIGTKLRVAGDPLYGRLPLVTTGLQWKRNRDFEVPQALGADDDQGVDVTVSVARLLLNAVAGRNLFTNLTLRNSEANQLGLLGFGGSGGRQWLGELSVGLFLNRHWVAGFEYREKPDLLDSVREDAWRDVFIGWFPGKRFSVIGAYTDLGSIAGLPDQSGFYLSVQLTQ